MVWAFATAGHAAPTLLKAIATVAVARLGGFDAQGLTNTVWAYATAGHAAPELLDAIAKAAEPRLGEFTPQALANTVWAFATAGHAAPALLEAIAAAAAPRLGEFNPQDLASTAWAFAAADHLAPALFDSHVFVQLCVECSLAPEALRQLHQWQLWREERGATWPPLPPALAQRCRDAFSSREGAPSELQRDVVASLRALGLAPREEVRRATASTPWSCTAGARWRSRSTAHRTSAAARPPARRRSSGGSCARRGGSCCRCPTGSGTT